MNPEPPARGGGCPNCFGQQQCLLGRQREARRDAWMPIVVERPVRKGELLLRQGQLAQTFKILKTGSVMMLRSGSSDCPSDTAIIVVSIRSMQADMGSISLISGPHKTRSSMLIPPPVRRQSEAAGVPPACCWSVCPIPAQQKLASHGSPTIRKARRQPGSGGRRPSTRSIPASASRYRRSGCPSLQLLLLPSLRQRTTMLSARPCQEERRAHRTAG